MVNLNGSGCVLTFILKFQFLKINFVLKILLPLWDRVELHFGLGN